MRIFAFLAGLNPFFMKTLIFILFIFAAAVTANAQSDTTHHQVDTIWDHIKIQIESEFPGGPSGWNDNEITMRSNSFRPVDTRL